MLTSHPHHAKPSRRHLPGVVLATSCAAILAISGTARAAVVVPVNVTLNAGLYTYSYSVTNTAGSLFDLAIVNVPVAKASNLMSLSAPTGFGISFDPGVGIVSFFEDADPLTLPTFAPGTTTAPFKFTSAFAPGTVTFDALDLIGTTFTGTTQAPVSAPAIPEPGSMMTAWLVGLGTLGSLSRRSRNPREISDNQPTLN